MSQQLISDTEECVKRIQSHKGVQGVIIANEDGMPIRTTMDNSTTTQYCGNYIKAAQLARNLVRDMDPADELCFLRIKTKKGEVMIAPNKEYMLLVQQQLASQQG